jgi:hypothetical protein
MRFPSVQSLAGGAWRTFLRFPIAIVLAIKATALGIWWTHLSQAPGSYGGPGWHTTIVEPPNWPRNAVVSCYLGMLLSVAMCKWMEKRRGRAGTGGGTVGGGTAGGETAGEGTADGATAGGAIAGGERGLAIGLQVGVLVLAGLYYWSLPPEVNAQMVIRTVVLALGLHWLIAVIGFGSGEVNGFWVFNKRLFLRALTAWLYSVVLYIGVSLALLAIEKLFNADIRFEVYEDCWWVLGGLFSVWFFLEGFPGSYENPAVISDYPRGLKIFTQYVLLSLVTIYLLILYAYMFKIIFTAHWPVGWVAWMVMAFAVAGILSLLLIYPLRNEENNTWIRSYTKFFYVALLPLIVLLFCAIYKRVAPYGITEQRYFLVALACWLLFITVYFLVSRRKDIRLVPLSLCILAFLSVWGPWGAFAVSVHSQKYRLAELLEKYGLMANGKVVTGKTGVKVSFKDRKTISSVTDYLVEVHGYKVLQPWFDKDLDSLIRRDNLRWLRYYGQSEEIVKLMNVEYANSWTNEADSTNIGDQPRGFYCEPSPDDSVSVTGGASYVAEFIVTTSTNDQCIYLSCVGGRLKICMDEKQTQLRVSLESGGGVSVADLTPIIRSVLAHKETPIGLPPSEMNLPLTGGIIGGTVSGSISGSISGKVVLTELNGTRTDSIVNFNRITGMILFSGK